MFEEEIAWYEIVTLLTSIFCFKMHLLRDIVIHVNMYKWSKATFVLKSFHKLKFANRSRFTLKHYFFSSSWNNAVIPRFIWILQDVEGNEQFARKEELDEVMKRTKKDKKHSRNNTITFEVTKYLHPSQERTTELDFVNEMVTKKLTQL